MAEAPEFYKMGREYALAGMTDADLDEHLERIEDDFDRKDFEDGISAGRDELFRDSDKAADRAAKLRELEEIRLTEERRQRRMEDRIFKKPTPRLPSEYRQLSKESQEMVKKELEKRRIPPIQKRGMSSEEAKAIAENKQERKRQRLIRHRASMGAVFPDPDAPVPAPVIPRTLTETARHGFRERVEWDKQTYIKPDGSIGLWSEWYAPLDSENKEPPAQGEGRYGGRYVPRMSEDEFILPFSDSQGYQNFGFGRAGGGLSNYGRPFNEWGGSRVLTPEEARLNLGIGNLL